MSKFKCKGQCLKDGKPYCEMCEEVEEVDENGKVIRTYQCMNEEEE